MAYTAKDNEYMKYLVEPEPGIVASRPFKGIENTANCVDHAAKKKPKKAFEGKLYRQRIYCGNCQPTHNNINSGRDLTRSVDPKQGFHQTDESQQPNCDTHKPTGTSA